MKDQHTKILGYRDLEQYEIDAINEVKAQAERVRELIAKINSTNESDKRWTALAATDLQKGFMALERAIARPETF